ncbi:unnamed protein product [marine sediment metagenome]|uniref:Uncharacterized protein n=1 Tax=marine sediment metagenome TaxID=412755 RepID=X1KIU8_9ZZZZ
MLNKDREEAFVLEHEERLEKISKLFRGKLRQARVEDYKNWLAGFLEKGGKPTHCYDYFLESSLDQWRVAFSNFQVIPLFGADALNIIIPNGIKFLGGELGHSTLYFMHDFSRKAITDGWVPIYSDIHF